MNIIKEVGKETIRLLKDRQAFNYLKLEAAVWVRGIWMNKE